MNLQVDPKPCTLIERPIDPFNGTLGLHPSASDSSDRCVGKPGTWDFNTLGFRVHGLRDS